MKYLLIPLLKIMVVTMILLFVPVKFLWRLIWHLEIKSFQYCTSYMNDETGKREYLFDRPLKQFLKELFDSKLE